VRRDGTEYYKPELDVLRFFAFLLVFVHHALPQEAGAYTTPGDAAAAFISALVVAGGLGVDLFFALSAFFITTLLLIEERTAGRIDVPRFLIRRALRIWPLYFAFLLASVYLIPLALPGEDLGRHFGAFLVFLGNWACVFMGYPKSVAAPLWSVSVEEQFYVAWPLLLLALGTKRIASVALVMLLIASAVRVALWLMGVGHPAVWANTFARLDPIAVGILLAWVSQRRSLTVSRAWLLPLVMTGSLMPPAAILLFGPESFAGGGSLVLYPAAAIGSGLLLLAVIFSAGSPPRWAVNPVLIHLGRVSYGLYVFHVLAIALVERYVPLWRMEAGFARMATQAAFAFVLTVVFAVLSYRMLERPFLKLKQSFATVRSAPV
jgi:peptidoglycan/LPS O-acetylase OafA/YrhL